MRSAGKWELSKARLILTRAQRRAIFNLWERNHDGLSRFRMFRRLRVSPGFDCPLVQWCGMTVGVEADGYTHT